MKIETQYSYKDWELKIVPLISTGLIKDISNELQDSFLYIGQSMRARIMCNNIKYNVSAWDRSQKVLVDEIV